MLFVVRSRLQTSPQRAKETGPACGNWRNPTLLNPTWRNACIATDVIVINRHGQTQLLKSRLCNYVRLCDSLWSTGFAYLVCWWKQPMLCTKVTNFQTVLASGHREQSPMNPLVAFTRAWASIVKTIISAIHFFTTASFGDYVTPTILTRPSLEY